MTQAEPPPRARGCGLLEHTSIFQRQVVLEETPAFEQVNKKRGMPFFLAELTNKKNETL